MRPIYVFLPVLLVLAFSGISFAKNCGGATDCNCSDTVNESYTMTGPLRNDTGGTTCPGTGLILSGGVTLDCGGNAITGDYSGVSDYGIDAGSFSSPVIKNCNVHGFDRGITLGFGSGATLVNNELHGNYGYGIYLSFVWGPVINDTHLFNNTNDYWHFLGSTDGPLTVNNMTFDRNLGDFVDETSISFYRGTGFTIADNTVVMDHSPATAGAPIGYTSFENKYLDIHADWSSEYWFDSLNWTWDASDDDSGGVELWRKNLSDNQWYLVSAAGDETNNILSLTNHTDNSGDDYIYALMKASTGCGEITTGGVYELSGDIVYTYSDMVDVDGAPVTSKACIEIESSADNLVFDCKGYSIRDNTGAGLSNTAAIIAHGIFGDVLGNVTIRNCEIIGEGDGDTDRGIVATYAVDVTIENVDVSGVEFQGVLMNRLGGVNLLADSKIYDNGDPVDPNRAGAMLGGYNVFTGVSNITVRDTLFYDNYPNDIRVGRNGAEGVPPYFIPDVTGFNLTFENVIFDDNGVLTDNATNISLDYAFTAGDVTYFDYISAPAPLRDDFYSVGNRYLAIETTNPDSINLTDVRWYWTDTDNASSARGEEYFGVQKHIIRPISGSWTAVGGPDDPIVFPSSNSLWYPSIEHRGARAYALTDTPYIRECGLILKGGTAEDPLRYEMPFDLHGVGSPECIACLTSNVIIDLAGFDLINDGTPGATGILVGGENVSIVAPKISATDPSAIEGSVIRDYHVGLTLFNRTGLSVDPLYLCNNSIGLLVNGSNDSVIDDVVFCNNTQYGLYVLDSDNTTIKNSRTFNNTVDFRVENNLGSPASLNISSLVFDNPSGDFVNYTDLYLTDSVGAGTAYNISWASEPAALTGNLTSFEGKYIDIDGTGPIDSIEWHWTDEESIYRGYDEALFLLAEYVSSYTILTSAVLDTVNNFLGYANLNPSSQYGILHNGSVGTPIELSGAAVSNITRHARYNASTAGNLSTEGGNITGANVNQTQLTDRWAAFYGNVGSSIALTGVTGSNAVYTWNWTSADGGVVCLSTNGGLNNLTAYPALGTDIDTAWGFNPLATDSGNRTFSQNNCTLSIGSANITNASYADTGPVGGFHTCAIKSTITPAKPDMLFCGGIISGGTFWNGATGDFEVMVPTNDSIGSTETYYFYMNLG